MTRNALTRRAGPLFGAWLVVVGLVAAVSPWIPPVAAIDPTPDPVATTPVATQTPAPTPDPTLQPTPEPTPDPSPEPTTAPTPDPTADPGASPTPAPDPTADPGASPSPTPTADPGASPTPTPTPTADPGASTTPTPTPVPTATPSAGGLKVAHFWVDRENEAGSVDDIGVMDDPRIGLTRFVAYRVRFQVLNDGDAPLEINPKILAGSGAQPDAWAALPAPDLEDGRPFYAASDNGGTFLVRTKAIPAGSLRAATSSDAAGTAVDGLFVAGRNPAPVMTLAPHTFTEIEFTVRATVDAAWKSAYAFRLDLGTPVLDRVDASVSLGAAPSVELTPGQKSGRPVEKPVPAYRLKSPTAATAATAAAHPNVSAQAAPLADLSLSPHMQYGLATDSCAACHSAHRATTDKVLLNAPASTPLSGLCFRCHDGTGAASDIAAQVENPAIPANDPATHSYYSHPLTAASNHTLDELEEFAGVSNRHAECADCHQPHRADDTASTPTTSGWTAGGSIVGAAGVAVTNGAANTVPTFTWQRTSDFEYQLCYKCHSGYTTLPARNAASPSRYALDKAVEFNPANLSYHPVEAAGTNGTSQMNASLAGTSPYKLWNFTAGSVIRCQNCHGPSTAGSPAADGQIDNHASANRGILLRNYRDRVLSTRLQPYAAADFALCYLCHAEAPMRDNTGNSRPDTNFEYHGLHMSMLNGLGSASAGTNIDVEGAGAGNATCAECHFRIHGSSNPAGGQTPSPRLVNFAPSVQAYQGRINFTAPDGGALGSCTLRCHGKNHQGLEY